MPTDTRIQASVAQLTDELPASVASAETIELHLRCLIEDYGLPAPVARQATKVYLTTSREGKVNRLATELDATPGAATPPRDVLAGDFELLAEWHVPLADAYETVRRAYIPDGTTADAVTPSSARWTDTLPDEVLDSEVAPAVSTTTNSGSTSSSTDESVPDHALPTGFDDQLATSIMVRIRGWLHQIRTCVLAAGRAFLTVSCP